ncbi:MAG TPA: porin family protein [Flavisolibacter sp.]|nr:porin family protein [Flavisolibacter sp.]
MNKKYPLTTLAILISFSVFSQTLKGVFGGIQSTTAGYKVRDKKQSTSSKTGGQLGMTLKIPFDNQLFFSPIVAYSLKGFTVQLTDSATIPGKDVLHNDVTVHAIDIAPLLQLDFSKNPSHLFVRFGPAIDVAFKGKERLTYKNGKTADQDMKFGSTYYGFITSSAIVHLGYETKGGFFVFGHYNHGLGSMNNNDFGPKIHHRIVGLSLGTYFGRRNPNVFDTRALDAK